MPLINLTTNLKGLGFGYDQPDGDSSKEPYIRVRIPDTNEALQTGFSIDANLIVEASLNVVGGGQALGTLGAGAVGGASVGAIAGGFVAGPAGLAVGTAIAIGDIATDGDFSVDANASVKANASFKAPKAGTGGPDFLLRGGTLLPNRIARDVERIGKLVLDTKSFKGILFTIKQNANVTTQSNFDKYQQRYNELAEWADEYDRQRGFRPR